jgi:hypothetical protein
MRTRHTLADNHIEQHLLEARERAFSHIYQCIPTLPVGGIDL